MPLSAGAAVAVRPFGNKRGVVLEAGRNGRYRVQVEGVALLCREEDLTLLPAVPAGRRAKPARLETGASASGDPAPPVRVDLHGLRVEEALARVVSEIDRALRADVDRLEIVHGKGSGRLRTAIHRQVASMPGIATFHVDPRNPGVTWVLFRG